MTQDSARNLELENFTVEEEVLVEARIGFQFAAMNEELVEEPHGHRQVPGTSLLQRRVKLGPVLLSNDRLSTTNIRQNDATKSVRVRGETV